MFLILSFPIVRIIWIIKKCFELIFKPGSPSKKQISFCCLFIQQNSGKSWLSLFSALLLMLFYLEHPPVRFLSALLHLISFQDHQLPVCCQMQWSLSIWHRPSFPPLLLSSPLNILGVLVGPPLLDFLYLPKFWMLESLRSTMLRSVL